MRKTSLRQEKQEGGEVTCGRTMEPMKGKNYALGVGYGESKGQGESELPFR